MKSSLNIHVFGGTSDAVALCQFLETIGIRFSLSVATPEGKTMASVIQAPIYAKRLTVDEMIVFLNDNKITHVIDATHPFAKEVSLNIQEATQKTGCTLLRYERETEIDTIDHDQVIKVTTIDEACIAARPLGNKILLTTGSKELGEYVAKLPNKTLIARVLPTVDVLKKCSELGLGINHIIAMKGPFTKSMNHALYEFCGADVVITKESGAEGGYQEKIVPALALNIPIIVVRRPCINYEEQVSNLNELKYYLDSL